MKKIIIFTLAAFSLSSCNLFFDNDTTAELSETSTKPTITLLGEPIISIKQGDSYNDAGVEAYVGNSLVDYTIVSGSVDVSQEGFYVVTYRAENQYGWDTYAYRTVLVYSGSPYGDDIAGEYKLSFEFREDISKHDVQGFWQMTNVYQEKGVEFPIVFADMGDNTYGIVPGEHITKGRYSGNAVKSGNIITFYLDIIGTDGTLISKEFSWTKI
ncbi:MAG: DUF5011 domain-containing protein [Bacteroidales bacterium]|nr:DUF5011 domain-containing protein [Bacteroidales bacterium]